MQNKQTFKINFVVYTMFTYFRKYAIIYIEIKSQIKKKVVKIMNTVNYLSQELRNKKEDLNNLHKFLENMAIQKEFIFNTAIAYQTAQKLIKQLEELENELYSQIAEKIKED